MADESNEVFPTLPAKQWWAIRERFKRSMPGQITATFLESSLGVNEGTARDLINQLRYLRLLDSDGKPTAIAEDWRHDDTYAKACAAILSEVYPEELLHVAPPPVEDRGVAQRWLARRKRVGENAGLKMAITYQLVAQGDLALAPDPARASKSTAKRARAEQLANPARARSAKQSGVALSDETTILAPTQSPHSQPASRGPSLHIDIQIHIAADASATQIDQIFASMAKHLYGTHVTKDAS